MVVEEVIAGLRMLDFVEVEHLDGLGIKYRFIGSPGNIESKAYARN